MTPGDPCPKCSTGRIRRIRSRAIGSLRVAWFGCNACPHKWGPVTVEDAKRPRGKNAKR